MRHAQNLQDARIETERMIRLCKDLETLTSRLSADVESHGGWEKSPISGMVYVSLMTTLACLVGDPIGLKEIFDAVGTIAQRSQVRMESYRR